MTNREKTDGKDNKANTSGKRQVEQY